MMTLVKGNRRISVRLGQEQLDRLQAHCQERDYDLSRVVRQALEAYLGSQPGPGVAGGVARTRLAPPEQLLPLTSKYLGWSGDLREHLKKLVWDLMAASWVCRQHYRRTPGMIELYEAVRPLAHFFGLEEKGV